MPTTPASTELAELLEHLSRVTGLERDVRDALGLTDDADVAASSGVQALHVERGDVLKLYLLTAGALVIHERTREGRALTITVPVGRVSRTAVQSAPAGTNLEGEETPPQMSLTLEIDADATTAQVDHEFASAPSADNGQRQGRARSMITTRRAGYVLTAEGDGIGPLRSFHRQLSRAVLGG